MKHVHVIEMNLGRGCVRVAVPVHTRRPVYVEANGFFTLLGYAGMPKRARAVVPCSLLRYVGNIGNTSPGDKHTPALISDRSNELFYGRLYLSTDVLRSLMDGAFGWTSCRADVPLLAASMLDEIVANAPL